MEQALSGQHQSKPACFDEQTRLLTSTELELKAFTIQVRVSSTIVILVVRFTCCKVTASPKKIGLSPLFLGGN